MPLHYAVLAQISLGYSPSKGRLPTCYSPVRHSTFSPKGNFAFDLHVWGTPPALILSQDQTLVRICSLEHYRYWSVSDNDSSSEFCTRALSLIVLTLKVHWYGHALSSFQRSIPQNCLLDCPTDVLNSPQANGDFNWRNLLCQATTQIRKMLFLPNKKAAFPSAISQRKAALIRAFQNS